MDFVLQLHAWIAGETSQGRVMMVAGTLLCIATFLILMRTYESKVGAWQEFNEK